ncbi:MAG: sigma-70 family RNA polymerase sigma factor [Verrucomicrobiaceae bacterium]|nr:sigma-70 family RNA polymerase sigma factor [Verrucomicrobiaceae bacterium]
MNTDTTPASTTFTTCTSAVACDSLYRRHYASLCAFARSHGCESHDAEDAAQDLFAKLHAQGQLDRAAAIVDESGQSAFLLARMRTLLIKRWRHRTRLRRGGGATCLSLHDEEGIPIDIADTSHLPDHELDRDWARAVLDRALQRISDELTTTGRGDMWQQLDRDLSGESQPQHTPRSGALRIALHRARRRLRSLIQEQLTAQDDTLALGAALA